MSNWRKRFKPNSNDSIEPALQYRAITPSDTTVYDPPFRGFIVGVAGNVAVVGAEDEDEDSVVLPNMVAGVPHSCSFKKLLSTGTTATTIIGIR